jgi:outer membrane receptor protein involved in Fe transport
VPAPILPRKVEPGAIISRHSLQKRDWKVTNKLNKAGRFGLNTSTASIALGVMLAASPAFAQTKPAEAAADAATDDNVIIVTGSLIKNSNLTASAPVNVTTSEEAELRQVNVAEDLLRQIPGMVPNIGSAVNNGNNGASYVDLRGLGSNRNIVLLDGTRIAPSNTIGRVDLNNIPLALIERTEVLTGGASTTYGADAISGVVNFITKQNFSGVEVSVGDKITQKSDGQTFRADVTIGANFDEGKGNAVFSIGYQQADPVSQGSRKFSNTQYSSTTGRASGSDVTVPAEFVLGNALQQINPATGVIGPVFQQFNFNPYNVFQTPFKRFNMFGQAHYEVADGIEVYTRGLYSKNVVDTVIAPSGIFDEVLTVPISNPYLPVAARNQFCADQGVSVAACNAAAVATNPNDPNYRTLDIETLRRTPDVGPRISSYETQIFDYRVGVRGDIISNIHFDVAGAYGESENTQTIKNYVLLSRAQQAVLATNTTTCLNTANNCVPLNIFGAAGSITPAMASFLTANSTSTNKTSLAQAHAILSGDFGYSSPWASNPIGFAAGGEYRKYKASQSSDLLAQTPGELGGAGGAAPNISGGYDVYEAFGELIAPIVADKPFFHELTVGAGIRYSHYTIFTASNPSFNTTTYKFQGTWAPVSAFKIRGNFQHAVRAPNINELFNPVTTGLTNLTTDPCAGAAPTTNANLAAICRAQGAPAASIGLIANPNSGQANETGGGNPLLGPEKSNSYTLGVVALPADYVRGLSISVDYYNIKVTGAITTPTPGDALNACFGNITAASATSVACTAIRRNPGTGQLSGSPATTFGLPLPLSNLGKLKTDGIDVVVDYRRDIGFAKLNLNFSGNWTHSNKFQATPTSINRQCAGYYSVNCLSIQPKYSWNQRTTLDFGDIDLSLLWRHISSEKFEPLAGSRFVGTLTGGDLAGQFVNFNRIKAYNYFDLAARVNAGDHVTFTFTVDNLFDKQPPVLGNTIGSTTYNSGNTYPSTYDTLGRTFAISAKVKL